MSKHFKMTKPTKKSFLNIFEKNNGSVTNACDVLGICRNVYYDELDKDPKFKQAIEDIKEKHNEELVILAKMGLKTNLNRNKQSAIEYTLNNKCKEEYSNTVKNEHTGKDGEPIIYKEYFPALDPVTKEEK